MAQAYSTPGNSSNDFYTPQASGTRRAQTNPASSYFGTGGQTGYSQSAWSGGNNGNPSGIGAGASGINAGDGPGAGSAGLNANGGPGGFMQAMNGQGGVPGSGGNFQWGSVTAGPWGTDYSDPATAQQYSDNMMASGDPYAGMYGSSAPTPMNNAGQAAAATAGMAGGTPGYDPSGGLGLQQGSSPFTLAPGSGSGGMYVNGQYVPGNYVNARGMERLNWEAIFNAGGLEAAAQQEQQRLQAEAHARQQQQMANAGYDPNSPLHWSQQMTGGGESPYSTRLQTQAMATSGMLPPGAMSMLPPEYQGQSQLGAAMQSGMPTQAIGQQMGAPGAVDPYSTALPESFAQGGYQPGDTSIPTGNIGGAPPYAVSPERFGRLPVNELQRIASGQGGQLRPELQQQAAMMASNELARRGAGGNNLAAGNQQAQDPRAVEQSTGFQQAERIRRLERLGIDTRGVTAQDALSGNLPATQGQLAEQQQLQQAGMSRQNQRMGLDLPELPERLRGNNVAEDNTQSQGFQGGGNELVRNGQGGLTMAPGMGGAVQFLQGLGQGLGWMNPTNIPGFGSSPSTPPPEVAMDPEALFRDSLAQVRQQYGPIDIFGEDGSTGAYGLENAIAGGYGSGAGMNLPPGMGGWNTTGAPDVPGVGTGQVPYILPGSNTLGPGNIPGTIGGDVPTRPLAPQGPGGVPQNPYEKMPGYVQPYSQPQSPMSTGNPIWGSQPQPSANPYPGTTQLMPFGQGLPPGISGSMAIGPDGKPYGGTPNLSRPEPNPSTIPGNDFPGYGNDVVNRPGPPVSNPSPGTTPLMPLVPGQPVTSEQRNSYLDAVRNAPSLNRKMELITEFNHALGLDPNGRPLDGSSPALLQALLGNPNYN